MHIYNTQTLPSLKIGSWNIQGLLTKDFDKRSDSTFMQEIKGYDIVGLIETHTTQNSHTDLQIDGYNTYCFSRPKHIRAKHGSGGIMILINPNIKKGTKIIKNSNRNDYVWLKLEKSFFELQEDIYLCIAYVPPQDSTYSKGLEQGILDQIETDIFKYKKVGATILMGDINARVGNNNDYIINDSIKHLPLDSDYILDSHETPRISQDAILDNRGKHLLEICIGAQMRLLNGRKLGDSQGYLTCHKYNGSSVVDYTLCSEQLLKHIPYFKVHPFLGTLSDHCMISFNLVARRPTTKHTNIKLSECPHSFIWHTHSAESFQATLRLPIMQHHIEETLKCINTCNNLNDINLATQKLSDIITESAKLSLKKRQTKSKNPKLPWSTLKLVKMEREVRKKASIMTQSGLGKDRQDFFLALKLLRKERKYAKRHFVNNQLGKLETLHKNNPKQYWQILKDLKDGHKQNHADNINPERWYDYLVNLNTAKHTQSNQATDSELNLLLSQPHFTELDFQITPQEVMSAIKGLKSNKTPGLDAITNEMIKCSSGQLSTCLLKLFNKILTLGLYPDLWSTGFIINIHKKGPYTEPENYRGITITSALGKLFNSILNNRLTKYLDDNNIISNTQIGFEQLSSTADHIFTLKTLIDKYTQTKSQKLYACFIDFRQAFDRVWHEGLFLKLARLGINNHFYKTIKEMYAKTNLCIKTQNKLTKFFRSSIGVRQGDNLSPTLFKIYINDLAHDLEQTPNTDPVQLDQTLINCLMYADDIVLLSTTQEGLQTSINTLQSFSNKWKLEVNLNKTKSMTFNTAGKIIPTKFTYNGHTIEDVNSYQYLGIHLDNSGSLTKSIEALSEKGLKAMYKLNKLLDHNYNIDIALHIFDNTVKPILLYGSEVWGIDLAKSSLAKSYGKHIEANKISQTELKFYRRILGVRRNTSLIGIRGELGRHPLVLRAIVNSIKHYVNIKNKPQNKLVKIALEENKKLSAHSKRTWFSKLTAIMTELNIATDIERTDPDRIKALTQRLHNKLKSDYETHWKAALDTDSSVNRQSGGNKLRTYRTFKQNFGTEAYLTEVDNPVHRRALSQLRLSSHPLNIEAQRGIIRNPEERFCPICNQEKVENEMHFLLTCPHYQEERSKINDILREYPNTRTLNNTDLFIWLMSNENKKICKSLAKYTATCLTLRKQHLNT